MNKLSHSVVAILLLVSAFFASTFWLGSIPAAAKIIEGMQVDNSRPAVLDRENPQVQAVIAIQEHYSPALLAIQKVVGTATGLTEQGNLAVLVFTKEPGTTGIPVRLDGVPVVVRMTGEFHALKPNNNHGKGGGGTKVSTTAVLTPPVPIGVSTGNGGECSAGTIGARLTDGSGNYYALSNNHVYALENAASLGSNVLQPGLYDTQCIASGNTIGLFTDYVPINFDGGNNTVDAAVAEISLDARGDPMVGNATPADGYGMPKSYPVPSSEIEVGTTVEKYGRTTQLTVGTITGINATITVNYGSAGSATFSNQIIVQSGKPFLKAGDSGSLVVTSSGLNPVGLLFAGDNSGKYGVANDINLVLDSFSGLTIDGAP
ncbi:MAG: hypothetical protein P8Y63_08630 [Deltaproteobacteria bacterium]